MEFYTRGTSGGTQNGTPHSSEVLRLALAATERGMAVFPIRGKHPVIAKCPEAERLGLSGEALAAHARTCSRVGHGFYDASCDRSRIHALFNAAGRSATGYGIRTGAASRLIVVDVDGPEGRREAERRGLRSGYVVKTGRDEGDGWHVYFTIPEGVTVKSRTLAPGLELKGDGTLVAGPGSLHPSRQLYRAVKDGEPSPAPTWLLEEPEASSCSSSSTSTSSTGPVSIDTAGPPILEGERNCTLTRICGRLHDGTRDQGELVRDLAAINEARCSPPLEAGEVRRIASSIYRRTPCKPRAVVSERVLGMVDYLAAAAEVRPVRGMAGASGWAIYNAGLDACRRFGREHPEGVTLSLDLRTWAQMAGTEASTVSRWLRRTPLVEVIERGKGRSSTTVLFRVPREGVQLQHSSTLGVSLEKGPDRSVASRPLLRTLYRSRWSERSHNPRRGVVSGTRRVREAPRPPRCDGIARMGKSRAALLSAVAECRAKPASRAELAARLARKPDALKKPLRWLMDAGLIVRTSRGHYAPASDLERRVEDARELGGEPEADRMQIARHQREREGYRTRHKRSYKAQPAPSAGETREHRESYPERRRAHIAHAIARLFADRPEYRNCRVGQIVCKLPDYLEPDFPLGPDGVPKDAEVQELLDGVAA